MRLRGSADDKVEVVKNELWLSSARGIVHLKFLLNFQASNLCICELCICEFVHLRVSADDKVEVVKDELWLSSARGIVHLKLFLNFQDVNEQEKVGDAAPSRGHRGENDERGGKSRGW